MFKIALALCFIIFIIFGIAAFNDLRWKEKPTPLSFLFLFLFWSLSAAIVLIFTGAYNVHCSF